MDKKGIEEIIEELKKNTCCNGTLLFEGENEIRCAYCDLVLAERGRSGKWYLI